MRGAPDEGDASFLAAARSHWHPVGRSRDLAPGDVTRVTLLGGDLALWRDHDGRLGLVEDLCIHRGTRLSLGAVSATGCVRCPYHGWEFDAQGACTLLPQIRDQAIPRKARVAAYRVDEHAGLIWASLVGPEHEARPCPWFPELERPGARAYVGEVMEWACSSARQIENFVDIAHFSVLHIDAFGNPDAMEVPLHEVQRSSNGWQLRTTFEYPGINPLEPPLPDGRQSTSPISFSYRLELPFTVLVASSILGVPYDFLVASQPVDATSCRVFWVIAIPDDQPLTDEVLEASEQMIFHADRRVVESQRPERLPLDLAAEIHLSFDKMAVAYRRALGDLGFRGSR